jgi:SAM-dependent methyltransferase
MMAPINVKSFIKSSFPRAMAAYQQARQRLKQPSLKTIFTEIYAHNAWNDSESVSGRGSTLAHTAVIRSELLPLLRRLNATSLLDAACGDFNWMRSIELGEIEYIGADIVPELIAYNQRRYERDKRKFIVADVSHDRLPPSDVILCRECLIHLSFARIDRVISNFRSSGAEYLLCTTHPAIQQNADCADGGWRSLNLQLPPFDFPPPVELIVEDSEMGKCLGVWRLSNL